jgi:hypothetical protein
LHHPARLLQTGKQLHKLHLQARRLCWRRTILLALLPQVAILRLTEQRLQEAKQRLLKRKRELQRPSELTQQRGNELRGL